MNNPYIIDPGAVTVAETIAFMQQHGLTVRPAGNVYRLEGNGRYSEFTSFDLMLRSLATLVAAGPDLQKALMGVGEPL